MYGQGLRIVRTFAGLVTPSWSVSLSPRVTWLRLFESSLLRTHGSAVRSPRLTRFCSSSSEKRRDYERILRAWTRANGRWTTDVHNSTRTFCLAMRPYSRCTGRERSSQRHPQISCVAVAPFMGATYHILVAHLQSQPVPLLIRTSLCTAFSSFRRTCFVVFFVLEISFP